MPSSQPVFQLCGPAVEKKASQRSVFLLPVFEEEGEISKSRELDFLDHLTGGALLEAIRDDGYIGAKGKTARFRHGPVRILLVGQGKKKGYSPRRLLASFSSLSSILGTIKNLDSLEFLIPEDRGSIGPDEFLEAIPDLILQSSYRSRESTKDLPGFTSVKIHLPGEPSDKDHKILSWGIAMGQARSLTRDLVNQPSNTKSVRTMVEEARRIGDLPGLETILETDPLELEKRMPSFFEVARGSLATDPPAFIRVKYRSSSEIRRKIALVGKSVIFDSGGYQVKPSEFMVTMKADMTGGAQVLATMEALSTLQPPHVEVTAYLAVTPNKIDSAAMLPDSIVSSTCGKKIEIRNTDAEGRLTLIDAVARALEDGPPDLIVTVATLTGAAKRSVGPNIALMSNQKEWLNRFREICDLAGDPAQNLEILEEDYEDIKSRLEGADIANINRSKLRGAQCAAAFVMTPTPESLPHIHLDIAGIDMTDEEQSTGVGQKSLIRLIRELSQD